MNKVIKTSLFSLVAAATLGAGAHQGLAATTSVSTSLNASQQKLVLSASPTTSAWTTYNHSSLQRAGVPYDYYNYNILMAFKNHDVSLMSKYQAISSSYKVTSLSYDAALVNDAKVLMTQFQTNLKGKSSQTDQVKAVVQTVANLMSYSYAGDTLDAQHGFAKGYYEGSLKDGVIAHPAVDYGNALYAVQSRAGICYEYSMLTQLGLTYAGLNSVAVSNYSTIVLAAAMQGTANYLHAWNEVQIGSKWYTVDSTWYDNGNNKAPWNLATKAQVASADQKITLTAKGYNTAKNYGLHTAANNAQTLY